MGWMAGVLDDPPGFPYTLPGRGVTRHLSHETRRDTRLGSRERDETRFLAFFFLILNDEIHRENTKCKKCRCLYLYFMKLNFKLIICSNKQHVG